MAYGKNIFIFGGNDARQKFNDLITIDLEKKNARIIAGEGDIPSPRFGHTCEIYKNNMYPLSYDDNTVFFSFFTPLFRANEYLSSLILLNDSS